MNLLGQAEMIGGTITNMIAFGIFCLLIFYFAKAGRMVEMLGWDKKKSREKSLDSYELICLKLLKYARNNLTSSDICAK